MTGLQKSYPIKERDFVRAGKASIKIKNLLKDLGFPNGLVRRVAICSYEAEMNVVMHGENGRLTVTIENDRLSLRIVDTGRGIQDIEAAMQEGFSTASDEHRRMGFGAGMGLPNMRKNADSLTIHSKEGCGTDVRMLFHLAEEGDADG